MIIAHKKNCAGFTLLETLLSLTILAALAGISLPIYQSFQVRNDLDAAQTAIIQSIRRAQILARASDGDTNWGVVVHNGGGRLYRGASYVLRDASFDELFDISPSITPSGISEVIFTKFTGLPQTTGIIILTSNANETRIITINTKGTISY